MLFLQVIQHGKYRPKFLSVVPVHPKYQKSANRTRAFITTNRTRLTVEKFGDIAVDAAVKHSAPVWTSAHDIALANPQWYRDEVHPGLHLIENVSAWILYIR